VDFYKASDPCGFRLPGHRFAIDNRDVDIKENSLLRANCSGFLIHRRNLLAWGLQASGYFRRHDSN